MNFEVNLPFSVIRFSQAKKKHRLFFSKLFFSLENTPREMLTIDISFSRLSPGDDVHQLGESALGDKKHFYILDTKKRSTRLDFHSFTDNLIELVVDPDFDLYYLFTFIIEPLLIIYLAKRGVLFLHASGVVDKKNKATIFSAWRQTGKTQSMMKLTKKGESFIGDDYGIIYKNNVYLYPKAINLFSYNLRDFPDIYEKLAITTRSRLRATSFFKKVLYQLSQFFPGSLSKTFFRLSELAETSTNITLSPSQLGMRVTEKASLQKVVLLQKTPQSFTKISSLSKSELSKKLYQTIRYELDDFFKIYLQYQYFFPTQKNQVINNFEANYYRCLRRAMIK